MRSTPRDHPSGAKWEKRLPVGISPHTGQRSARWELSLPECLGCKRVSSTWVRTVQCPLRSPRQRVSRAWSGLSETLIVLLPVRGAAIGTEEPVGIWSAHECPKQHL